MSAPGATQVDRRNDPFGKSSLPTGYTQQRRVLMFAEVAQALIEGRQPSRAAALFVGGALLGWLARGGNLVRDYLGLTGRRGDNRATPWAIYSAHQNEREER